MVLSGMHARCMMNEENNAGARHGCLRRTHCVWHSAVQNTDCVYSITNRAFSPQSTRRDLFWMFVNYPWESSNSLLCHRQNRLLPVPLLDRFWASMLGAFWLSNCEANLHKVFLRRSIFCWSLYFFSAVLFSGIWMIFHCRVFSGIALCQGLLCLIPGGKGNYIIISEKSYCFSLCSCPVLLSKLSMFLAHPND